MSESPQVGVSPQVEQGPSVGPALIGCAVGSAALASAVALLLPLVPDEARTPAIYGAAVAAGLGLVTALVKARALQKPVPADPDAARNDAMRIQALLLSDLVVQLMGLGVGLGILKLSDAKFAALGGFALADAAVVMLNGIGSAAFLSQALRRRVVHTPSSTDSSGSSQAVDAENPEGGSKQGV